MRRSHPILWLASLSCLVAADSWSPPDGPSLYENGSYATDVLMLAGNETWTNYPDNEGSSGNSTHTFKKRAEDFYLRILPLGASITRGVFSSDNNGYRKALREQLRFEGWKVNMVGSKQDGTMADNDNEGHPGPWVHQVNEKFRLSSNQKPNLVLVNAGTGNDCENRQDPETTIKNMRTMIDEIFKTLPDTTVILSSLVKSGKDDGIKACAAAVSQGYRNLVYTTYRGYRISYANIHKAISLNQIDYGTHPTDEGYRLFASVWVAAINRIAKKIKPPPNVETVNDAEVTKTTKCQKIPGTARRVQTQRGSGHDDGNYVHDRVERGIIESGKIIKYTRTSAPGSPTDDMFFANIVKGDPNSPRSASLDDLVYATIDESQELTWMYRRNLGAGGSFGPTVEFKTDLNCGVDDTYAFGDFNNDGLDDFFCIKPGAAVWASLNRATKDCALQIIGQSDRTQREVRMADIDGDGRVDFCLVSDDDVKCSRNGGKGDEHFWQGFQTASGIRETVFNARSGPLSGVELADLNGDYRADFLYVGDKGNVDTYINQRGSGKGIVPDWRKAGVTHPGQAAMGVRGNIKFGRIYGSGRLDYIYMKEEEEWFDMIVFENKGSGGTRRKGDGNFYCDMRGTSADDLVWIYYDGRVDEINTNIHSPPNWGHDTSITLTVPGPRTGIHFADWTGNGRCDVLVQNKATGTLTLYENNYDAGAKALTFSNRGVVTEGWGVGIFDRGMRLADIDGDGRADPICIEISGRMTAWLNRQSGLLDAGQIKFAESWDRANIRFADVENSGRADIIWMNKYTGASTAFKNNGYQSGGAAGGSSFSWTNRGVLYSGVDRGECLHFANLGGLGRADLIEVDPATNTAYTNFNECNGSGGDDGAVSNPGLPSYSTNDPLILWDYAPVYAQDSNPPYPPLKNDDESDIAIENLRETRLFGFYQCDTETFSNIKNGWRDFNRLSLMDRLSSNIDWNSQGINEFFGQGDQKTLSDDKKRQIQNIFYYTSQMWTHWWTDWGPPKYIDSWQYLWIEVSCSLGDGSGDPKNYCGDKENPSEGGPAALITWKWHENRYTRALVCRKYTTLGKDLDDLTRYMNTEKTAEDRLNLANWEHARGGYWLHEATHMDYFMNTPSSGSGPVVRDLLVNYSDGRGENKAYGIDNAKKLANYDRHFTPGEYTQQNSDNYRFYAMSKWVEANSVERTYPYKPSVNPFAMPVFPPKVPDEG
ncbi:hypothetical protein CABS01_05792 [Colletotrichum abscissum]|uniref:uncharacterized protein n=1 Tax=Colletotrichum abscissum TaxID=1671311 RepID=UPI0027D6F60E|nr:uncharacterized protein CABS01_05792 [Colletotrichum abscissum]KAK1518258.1 hypothetical protein CABS01_05792 [Colletotrichum abscissum]